MLSSDSFVDRSASVSSMRRISVPSLPRASSQLNSAVRALPTWSWPVGLGAKRTRMEFGIVNLEFGMRVRIPNFLLLNCSYQGDSVGRNGLASADCVDAFVGLSFDAHACHVDADRVRDGRA